MNAETVDALCKELMKMEIKYVLVGRATLELHGHDVGTMDVDFAVTLKEFEMVLSKLKGNPRFRNVEDLDTIGSAEFLSGTAWVDVEFINPRLFCGSRRPDYFVEYVMNYRSMKSSSGYVARPEVVWYMRLIVRDWEIYVQKIMRDVRAGVPATILDDVEAIGRVFGAQDVLKERIRRTREYLEMI